MPNAEIGLKDYLETAPNHAPGEILAPVSRRCMVSHSNFSNTGYLPQDTLKSQRKLNISIFIHTCGSGILPRMVISERCFILDSINNFGSDHHNSTKKLSRKHETTKTRKK